MIATGLSTVSAGNNYWGNKMTTSTDQASDSIATGVNTAAEGQLEGGIFYRHWRAPAPVRAVILLAHGLGEHSGRYQTFAEYFSARGISVVAPDHIGHGVSPGDRAHVSTFDDYLGPLGELRDEIERWYPGLPCFLVGHSMGGLIAVCFLLDHQHRFTGVALSGAAFAVPQPPSAVALLLNRFISWCRPKMGLLKLDATEISRDPKVVQDYIDDPLVHDGKVSARLVAELFKSMQRVKSEAGKITLPILLMHGSEDVMAASEGSVAVHGAVSSADKTLKIYSGLYHEIFNEPEKLEVMADLASWLDARM